MILISAVIVGLLVGFLSGGSFRNVAGLRIRYLPLLVGAVVTQVLIFSRVLGTRDFIYDYGPYIYIVTLFVTLAVMHANWHIPGMGIIALGALLNAIVITANGGYMPAPEDSLREAGLLERVEWTEQQKADNEWILTNSTVANDDTNLLFLGDVVPVPDAIPYANVISIGDFFIGLGAAIAIVMVMHRRPEEADAEAERDLADSEKAPS